MYDQSFGSVKEYKEFLHTKNVSYALDNFISQKMGNEVEFNLQCSFTRVPISKPIRHSNLANIKCIFDFDTWADFFEQRLSSSQTGSFSCPGCKQYTSFSDFGLDFTLFNVLQIKERFEQKTKTKLLKDKIIYSISSGKSIYYGVLQQDKQTRVPLPGINPIVRISNTVQLNQQLSPNQQVISDQINISISKLQNFNTRLLGKGRKLNLSVENIRKKWEARKKDLVDLFRKSMKLIELGVKSIKCDFVFGFKKLFKDQKPCGSVLIVFYPHLGIWSEYAIPSDKHFQYEQVLFIKDQTQIDCNIIYAIGGKVSNLIQTNQFLRITFPKDPFTNEKTAKIEYLPALPKDGFNYLGSVYNGQIYLFCGQRKYEGPQQLILEEIIDKAYVYQKNTWKQINQKVEKRFDGSQIVVQHQTYGKIIILYGGTARVPDGQIGYANQEQQHIVQIFQFSTEKFLGNGFKLIFSDKPENKYQKFMLCTPIFSVPYGSHSELLIGGDFLKRNWKENKEKFVFDWATGEIQLSEFQSTQPVEQQLTTYMKRNWSSNIEFVTPTQDLEGAVAYGVYYTIHQTEVIKDQKTTLNIVQLLEYNLANGTLSTRPYATRETTQEQAKKIMANLIQSENIVL